MEKNWTINDAKDGDIVVLEAFTAKLGTHESRSIFVFKNLDGVRVRAYCTLYGVTGMTQCFPDETVGTTDYNKYHLASASEILEFYEANKRWMERWGKVYNPNSKMVEYVETK